MAKFTVLLTGGGTGGHLFPAMAIGKEIKNQTGANTYYIGSTFGIESTIFPHKGFNYTLLPIRGLQRNFSMSSIGKNILLPGRLIRSIRETKKVFQSVQPNFVVGTGGYASALPLYVARQQSIPYFIQEQNSYPGITTRHFAKDAEMVFIAFPEVESHFKKKTSFWQEIQSEVELIVGIA